MTTQSEVIAKCDTLKRFWAPRNKKFKEWYRLLEMVDELATKDMESFVGNDPRASFNLLSSMLEQKIPHRILPENLLQLQVAPAADLSKTFDIAWKDVHNQYRRRGRYFLRDLINLILVTGWYSVFAIISADGSRCVAEVWNPATVFPAWDDDLTECAHIFSLSEPQAKRLAARNNWTVPAITGKTTCYDYWMRDDADRVINSIVLGTTLVKNDVHEIRFKRIPIFTSPVGGLPDTGEIVSGTQKWKEEIGQAWLVANENIYRYWNKWWSFSMQLLRDTAQARTYEKSSSAKQIVKPEDWYRRGAHFKMGLQDEIGFITPPAIPMELRTAQLDMEAMMQRGGPSWAMFGSVQPQMTAYVMSQVSASINQISKPYHQGVIDCISDIDNFWLDLAVDNNYKLYGRGIPADLPENPIISAEYELRIPGDLTQRVTTARIMNPAFELSDEKVMEELFPEIKNPVEEMAKIEAGKARRHPIHATIALIESCRNEANLLRDAGDPSGAELYEKAAATLEASLTLPEQEAPSPQEGQRGFRPPSARPEVVPPPGSESM